MSEQVHDVTTLPKPHNFRKFATRAAVLAVAGTVAAVVVSKLRSNEETETEETTTQA